MTLPAGKPVRDVRDREGVTIQGITTPWHTWVQFHGEPKPETVRDDRLEVLS
jgi:hypothetical protein